jgi:diguanylate cyclase (GGDEF)-like protein/PAS domain S-box-containing protein
MTRARAPGAEERFDDLVGSLNAIVWEADGDDYHMTFVSPRSVEITGYSPDQWMTEPAFWESRLHPDDRERAIAETDAAIGAMRNVSLEYRFKVRSGDFRWFSDVIRVLPKRGGSGHRLVGVMIDISSQKRLEEELAFRASHDPLTGLLNREQLDSELARVRVLDEPWALLFLDLDDFKDVNDGLGHAVGDEVLRVVARRLRHSAREGDVVARFGGDEFAVLAAAPDRETAEALAARLREQIRLPIAAGEHILSVGASVGIALVDPRAPIGTVMRKADAAMYWAKQVDAHVSAYEEWMQERALRRLEAMAPGPADSPVVRPMSERPDRATASRSA